MRFHQFVIAVLTIVFADFVNLAEGNCPKLPDGVFRAPDITFLLNYTVNGSIIKENDGKVINPPSCKLDMTGVITKYVTRTLGNTAFFFSRTLLWQWAAKLEKKQASTNKERNAKNKSPSPNPQPGPTGPPTGPPSLTVPATVPILVTVTRKPEPLPMPRRTNIPMLTPSPSERRPPWKPKKAAIQVKTTRRPYMVLRNWGTQTDFEPFNADNIPETDPRYWGTDATGVYWKPGVRFDMSARSVTNFIQESSKLRKANYRAVVPGMLIAAVALNVVGKLLHALAATLPVSTGAEKCFLKVNDYIEAVFKRAIPQHAVAVLQGYENVLKDLAEQAETYCRNCTRKYPRFDEPCVPVCDSHYIQRLINIYDSIERDRNAILEPVSEQMWSIYYLRHFCSNRFLVGAQILTYLNATDDKLYQIYTTRVKEDAISCIRDLQIALDKSVQRLVGVDDLRHAPALRAVLCRDLRPYFSAYELFTNFSTCNGGAIKRLIAGDSVMLRHPGLPKATQWFSCADPMSYCNWTSCPGDGPLVNESRVNAWQKCRTETFKIFLANSAQRIPIKAEEEVNLYSNQNLEITWALNEFFYERNCIATYLTFVALKYDADRGQSRFSLAVWDWSGRRRKRGEDITDRDWVVFQYVHEPDYTILSKGRGFFYLEGFLFIAPKA